MCSEPDRPLTLGRRWKRFWATPDSLLVDAGAAGELLVGGIRVFVTLVLITIPIVRIMAGGSRDPVLVVLGVTAVAVVVAVIVYLVVRARIYHPWLGFVTSFMDVTLVSSVLVTFLILDQPHLAVNNKVVFPVYFLAIAATALRYDARISALTGLIAVLEYAAVVAWADTHWPLNDPSWAPFRHGMFDWNDQYGRLLLLACAGLISTVVVLRSQKLRWLSASDPLTGLMNRGFIDERLVEEEIRAKRYERPLAVAMIDIDEFKGFNDTYGHASGDEALRVVASAIRRSVRRTDLVARYGGEEFMVAFPETPGYAAVQKAEDIRRAVRQAGVILRGSRGVAKVAVSIGVAAWPEDGPSLRAVIEAADGRLYQAKQAGRDQVVGG